MDFFSLNIQWDNFCNANHHRNGHQEPAICGSEHSFDITLFHSAMDSMTACRTSIIASISYEGISKD